LNAKATLQAIHIIFSNWLANGPQISKMERDRNLGNKVSLDHSIRCLFSYLSS